MASDKKSKSKHRHGESGHRSHSQHRRSSSSSVASAGELKRSSPTSSHGDSGRRESVKPSDAPSPTKLGGASPKPSPQHLATRKAPSSASPKSISPPSSSPAKPVKATTATGAMKQDALAASPMSTRAAPTGAAAPPPSLFSSAAHSRGTAPATTLAGAACQVSNLGAKAAATTQGGTGPYGSMTDNGFASMQGGAAAPMAGSPNGLWRSDSAGQLPVNGYGSMGAIDNQCMNCHTTGDYGMVMAGGSAYGPMGSLYGGMGYAGGSMYGGTGEMPGDAMYGPMGSLYGGMGNMRMGSVCGAGGMPMGSLYGMMGGMGGGIGSLYGGIGGGMGSLYGGMGSMYGGTGSLYGGFGRYNSMGLGSSYASFYGLGRAGSRASFRSSGGYVGGSFGGLWRAPSGFEAPEKQDYTIPPPSTLLSEMPRTTEKVAVPRSNDQDKKKKLDAAEAPKEGSTAKTSAEPSRANGTKAPKAEQATEEDAAKATEKSRNRGLPTSMASSHRLTKQVNDNVHAIVVAPKESMLSRADRAILLKGGKFPMDEVMVAPVEVGASELLTDLVEQTQCGHNASALMLCGSRKYSACLQPVIAVLTRMMQAFAENKNQVTQVKSSAVALAQEDKVVDLLAADAKPAKPEMGSNPICGPCVMSVSEKDVLSAAEACSVVMDAAVKGEKSSLVFIIFRIKQIHTAAAASGNPGAASTKDVYVSSMLVVLANDGGFSYLKAAEKNVPPGIALLFINAIGGASRTVAMTQLLETDEDQQMRATLTHLQRLRDIKNMPTRSGNVRRFIDYTERAVAANAATSPRTTARIARLLKDAKAMMANPEEAPLLAYSVMDSTESSKPSEAQLPRPQPLVAEEVVAATYAATPAAAATKTPATASAAAAAKKFTTASPAAAKTPAATPAAAAPKEMAQLGAGNASSTPASPNTPSKPENEKKIRLVVCTYSREPIPEGQMEADEVICNAPGSLVLSESQYLTPLKVNLGLGRNVALLSVETQTLVPLKDQYTWKWVESTLIHTLSSPPPSAKHTWIELFMAVVQKRNVLCDLMADAAALSTTPKPLGIASSPLFGPIPVDTAHMTLLQASDVQPTLERALQRAVPHLTQPDAMIIMTAVLKRQQSDDDVLVASFMAASGPSADGLRGALSKNPEYSRSLFSYAIGGPCMTSLLLCVGKDYEKDAVVQSGLAEMRPLAKQPNHTSRNGSVVAFLQYAKNGLTANLAKSETATGEERERLASVSRRLQLMHDDYKVFLGAPADTIPPYYMGDKRVSAAPSKEGENSGMGTSEATKDAAMPSQSVGESSTRPPVPIRTVVIVRDSAEGASAEAADTAMEVTEKEVILQGKHYAPSEVIRANDGALRSNLVDELHKIVLDGYNVALLTNDMEGNTVDLPLIVRTVTVILQGLGKGGEAFWTVVVAKGHQVKDMLTSNASYYDLHLASSPLFGNVAYGAQILPVQEAQIEPMMREVRSVVREDGGVCYISLILRLPKDDGDVCLPVFFVAIAGQNTEVYNSFLSTRSNDAILSSFIGGPCHTVYVAGIRGRSAEAAQPMMEVAAKMSEVRSAPLRSGSLKRFIAHTEPAVAALQRKIDSGDGAPNVQLTSHVGRISTILKDAQNMLKSSGGSIPAVYKR